MRSSESTDVTERILIALRWASFGLLALLESTRGPLESRTILFLFGLFLLQVLLAAGNYLNLRIPRWGWIIVAVIDTTLLVPIYAATGGSVGPALWSGLIPGMTIAISNGSILGVIAVTFIGVAQAYSILVPEVPWPAALTLILVIPQLLMVVWARTAVLGLDYRLTIERRKRDDIYNRELDRLKTLVRSVYRMASAITGSLEPLRILDTALDLATEGSGEKGSQARLVSAALLRDEHDFFIATARRLTRADLRATFPGEDGALARILRSRMPTRLDSPGADSELSQVVALHACRSGILLPLVVDDDVRGALLFAHPDAGFIEGDLLELVEGLTKQTASTLRNAELYQALRDERDRLVEVEEEARKKLARDLHDGPIQATAAIAMRVNYARRLLQRKPETTGEELFEIEELARRATKEMRHMLFTLRPLVLETNGIAAALKQLAEKTRDTFNQEILLDVDPQAAVNLDLNRQGVLFNLVEEAVGNARKHSKAAHIWVRMQRDGDGLFLEVVDDGVGFNVADVEANYSERGSLGMVNLRERAELAGGSLQLHSAPGKGTRVQVKVPGNIPPQQSAAG